MPLYPGDPLTPGIGATENAKRLDRKDALTLTKIPVLPISYGDALPLLRSLGGSVAPPEWRGALPITYHIGPGATRVHLKLEFDWKLVPAYDVIAKLKGSERPDEWILRGNHHDAWVFGADDPVSGMVALMEEARVIGELVKQGWKPKRTIVYAAWDAEEPGLLGSTEWAETHAEELKKKAVVYINSDSNGRGFLGVGGSHTLEKFVNQVARDVTDPQKNISVSDRVRAYRILRGDADERREALEREDLRISALGSGSDYTPFIQHLGIASLNVGYGGEDGGGSYHSNYDTFEHFTRFGDPNFDYGIALAQTCGRLVMRFADADVLPFAFMNFSDTVETYIKEITKLTDTMRDETVRKNRLVADKTYEKVADSTEVFVAPKSQESVPHLNFAALQNAFERVRESSRNYDAAMQSLAANGRTLSLEKRKQLDAILMQSEQSLINDAGLPRRSWFKHQIYAPGFYTGYGVKTLPGIREAVEQRNWREAGEQIEITAATLTTFAARINQATKLLTSD